MSTLIAGAQRYPLLIVVAVIVALALIAFAADWFVGRAERDEPTAVRR